MTSGGITPLPDWFTSLYTKGRRLALGFGGYFSIISKGSLGPTFFAIAPPTPGTNAEESALSNQVLSEYSVSENKDRMHRPANYITATDNWEPQGNIGYMSWKDLLLQDCTAISTQTLQGMLCVMKLGEGRTNYLNSDVYAERSSYWWVVYDMNDLAAVANGTKQPWQIQPRYEWKDTVMTNEDADGYSGPGYSNIGGVTFDPTSNKLYIQNLGDWTSGCCDNPPSI
jgi:hypothetical protein